MNNFINYIKDNKDFKNKICNDTNINLILTDDFMGYRIENDTTISSDNDKFKIRLYKKRSSVFELLMKINSDNLIMNANIISFIADEILKGTDDKELIRKVKINFTKR